MDSVPAKNSYSHLSKQAQSLKTVPDIPLVLTLAFVCFPPKNKNRYRQNNHKKNPFGPAIQSLSVLKRVLWMNNSKVWKGFGLRR